MLSTMHVIAKPAKNGYRNPSVLGMCDNNRTTNTEGAKRWKKMETITFDAESIAALKECKRKLSVGQALFTVVFSSVWLLLLMDGVHGLGKNTYSLPDTEWNSWKAALRATNAITRYQIEQIAQEQAEIHGYDPKQRAYWLKVLEASP